MRAPADGVAMRASKVEHRLSLNKQGGIRTHARVSAQAKPSKPSQAKPSQAKSSPCQKKGVRHGGGEVGRGGGKR